MTKIVYNTCFGGFGLSDLAIQKYKVYGGQDEAYNMQRTDPILVKVVEELGDRANGPYSKLAIVELSPGTKYRIDEYDGNEQVMTIDDYDWATA